jgi:diguanylate cyclase (GGDEF)-like protein
MNDALARELKGLTSLAVEVQRRRSLEDLLQIVVDRTSELIGAGHVSLRLLDPTRTSLVATCRTGRPVDTEPHRFALGEGLVGWVAAHAEPLFSNDAPNDPRYLSREGIPPVAAYVGVPLLAGARCVGVLGAVRDVGDPRPFDPLDQHRLELIAAICAPHLEIVRLQRLSTVDPLTGALNRRGLDGALPAGLVEGGKELCVALADIDHFKQVNDDHGHAVGDEVLKHVARCLSSVLRSGDAIVRYGGEEFVMLLADVGMGRAFKVAERARAAVARSPVQLGDATIHCTISVGVAERRGDETRDDLIARADAAMYAAKSAGRDRVFAAE